MRKPLSVTIHTKTGCPNCERAKEWLADHQIPFTAVLHDDDAERAALYESFGLEGKSRTVPQVVLTDEDGESWRLGGYDTLTTMAVEKLFA